MLLTVMIILASHVHINWVVIILASHVPRLGVIIHVPIGWVVIILARMRVKIYR